MFKNSVSSSSKKIQKHRKMLKQKAKAISRY